MKLNAMTAFLGAVLSMSVSLAHAGTSTNSADGPQPAPKKTVTVQGGSIHFQGSLVDAACAVSSASSNQLVNMGQYTLHSLKAKGDTTIRQPFKIQLEDCSTDVASTASVAFTGQPDGADADYLAVNADTSGNVAAAKHVAIQLLDAAGKAMKADGSTFSTAKALTDGTNVLSFTANYIATDANPTAGAANSDATFVVRYQ
jgi:major type 1 subunit fimbrin (pilin)